MKMLLVYLSLFLTTRSNLTHTFVRICTFLSDNKLGVIVASFTFLLCLSVYVFSSLLLCTFTAINFKTTNKVSNYESV